jgi:hypothetical protein
MTSFRVPPADRPCVVLTLLATSALLLFTGNAHAQTAPPTAAQQADIVAQIKELQAMRAQMASDMAKFDARIGALEIQLQASLPPATTGAATTAAVSLPAAAAPVAIAPSVAVTAASPNVPVAQSVPRPAQTVQGNITVVTPPEKYSVYAPGKGLVILEGNDGSLQLNGTTYFRYLNQLGLKTSYTDYFGRTNTIDRRQDFQLAKVQMTFKGWIFDPRFNYNLYFWTSNASQGLGAQVVGAGNISFWFSDAFQVYAGVQSLPTTRSTNRTFPSWLRNDSRPIADEYFRGSYSQGVWVQGKLTSTLEYRAMIANNLSALGVNAGQLDSRINTISGALTWMPTTGEYGPQGGVGDFENHQDPATLFGIHYTNSVEDKQSQPGTDSIENTQIRLSDGTLLFKENAFNTPGTITQARYQMLDVNGGIKYMGFSFDSEFYFRWLDHFVYTGEIPVNSLFDYGMLLQTSKMLIDKKLQAYAQFSKVYGDYGHPEDFSFGLNWWPLKKREFRVNFLGTYVQKSPVGYSAYPLPVGADGFVFLTDFALIF